MHNINDFHMYIKTVRDIKTSFMPQGSRCTHSPKRPGMGFVCFLEGELEYKFYDGKTFTFAKGDLVFFKETPYIAYINKDSTHLVLNFEIDEEKSYGDLIAQLLKDPYPLVIDKSKFSQYRSIIEKAINITKKNHLGVKMLQLPICYEIMYDMLFSMYLDNVNKDTYNHMLTAKIYIDDNFQKDISITYLAKMLNISETGFRCKFADVFGVPPSEYINTVRINKAKNYFAIGAYSVGEVAKMCGFSDTNYFCRFFKKHTGTTPMKYKMSLT